MFNQIVFLPWAALRVELQVGPVRFWPFNRQTASKYVTDVPTRKFLYRYFRRYRNPLGKPVGTVVVASLECINHRILNNEELDDIRTAIHCLAFSVIGPDTKSKLDSYPPGMTKEPGSRYDLYIQNFTPENFRLSVPFYGSVELNKIHLARGMSISEHPINPDRKLLAALGKFLWSTVAGRLKIPVARGLEWFTHAHKAADRLSDSSQIVMMATAFETLLQVQSEPYKASSMATKLETLIRANDWAKRHTRPIRYNNGVRHKTRALPGWWIWNFYQARNRIVHGEPLLETDIWIKMKDGRKYSQVSVATALFLEAIVWQLSRDGLYEQSFDFGKLHDDLAWSKKRNVRGKS